MAILTGSEIKRQIEEGRIEISPYFEEKVQPNSYDISLGDKVSYYSSLWIYSYNSSARFKAK